MRIAVLTDPAQASTIIRLAPRCRNGTVAAVRFLFASSCQDLIDWAGEDGFDLAVVQLCFGDHTYTGGPGIGELTRLRSICHPERFVLIVRRPVPSLLSPIALDRMGFPFVLIHGADRAGAPLLRALARAWVRRRLRSATHSGWETTGDLGLMLRIMAGWPPVRWVPEMARQVNTSRRNLNRLLKGNGLPPAGALLAGGRFLEACVLAEWEVGGRERIASILEAGSAADLAHKTRRFSGRSLTHFVGPKLREDPFEWILLQFFSSNSRNRIAAE